MAAQNHESKWSSTAWDKLMKADETLKFAVTFSLVLLWSICAKGRWSGVEATSWKEKLYSSWLQLFDNLDLLMELQQYQLVQLDGCGVHEGVPNQIVPSLNKISDCLSNAVLSSFL